MEHREQPARLANERVGVGAAEGIGATALLRHLQRASLEVMEKGGFTPESGRLMQQLIDLQGVLTE